MLIHFKPRKSLQRRFIDKAIFAVAVVQPLCTVPQILVIYGRRNASGIAISSWLLYIVFDLLWLWYGICEKQKAVIISAIMFTLMEGMVVVGALMYGGVWA